MASLLALPPDPQVLFLCLLVLVVLVFASARLDVPLHLAGWLLFGAHFAGRFHTRILPFIDPLLSPVQVASDVVIDILPGSSSDSWVVLLLSTLLTLAATGMLSGTHSYRGSWLTYVLVRALFPMSMSKESANDIPHILLYSFVTASSLMGPMASWPSRSFAAADAGYAIATDMMRPATEHAVISVLLCFSHDFVARYLLQFLESAAFTVAMVFIGQISLLVASGSSKTPWHTWSYVLNPWLAPDFLSYLSLRAPPLLITAWALGIHVRTITQGRVGFKQFAATSLLAMAAGVGLAAVSKDPVGLAAKPVFAAVVCILAMGLSTALARRGKRRLPRNEWIPATGFFVFEQPSHEDDDEAQQDEADDANVTGQAEAKGGAGVFRKPSSTHEFGAAPPAPLNRHELQMQYDDIQAQIHVYKQRAFRQEAVARGCEDAAMHAQAKLEVEKWQEQERRAREELERIAKLLDQAKA